MRPTDFNGLETIKIDDSGQVVLHRMMSPERRNETSLNWESATTTLPKESVTAVLNAVKANRLMELEKEYHHTGILDGTQWVLWIEQEDREKAVYFNNHFPERIKKFARSLDDIVLDNPTLKLNWMPVPEQDMRKHERDLWDKLNR